MHYTAKKEKKKLKSAHYAKIMHNMQKICKNKQKKTKNMHNMQKNMLNMLKICKK